MKNVKDRNPSMLPALNRNNLAGIVSHTRGRNKYRIYCLPADHIASSIICFYMKPERTFFSETSEGVFL